MSLFEDIQNLENDAPRVLKAKKKLNSEIIQGVEDGSLLNGSRISLQCLNSLSSVQKHRVLPNFNGRNYERSSTHHQYKVTWDTQSNQLIITDGQVSPREHVCILRIQKTI